MEQRISISTRTVRQFLLLGVGLMFIAHVVSQFCEHVLVYPSGLGLIPRFNMNGEQIVPTWYASSLLLLPGVGFATVAAHARRSRRSDARSWLGLALISCYLSIDEEAGLHELLLQRPSRALLGDDAGWLYFAWALPALVVVGLVALPFVRFLLNLPRPTKLGFVAAGLVYCGAALGLELVGGWYSSTRGDRFNYELLAGFEESLEMVGAILVLSMTLAHAAALDPRPRIELTASASAAESCGVFFGIVVPVGVGPASEALPS